MKTDRGFAKAYVTVKAERALEEGHPWVYDTEILEIKGSYENGGLLDIVSGKEKYLGTGMISETSKIRVRLLSRNANDRFDVAFFTRRIQYAWNYRKAVMQTEQDLQCCRVIFGEADFFPGLTVDRFGDVLVAQVLSLGMERLKPVIFPLLIQVLRQDGQEIRGIYERNDVAIRKLEGLEEGKGWYLPQTVTNSEENLVSIVENDIQYEVDVVNGQKTGFFLDQKYNRAAVAKLAKGKRVLDCFTHTGSFALNAAKGGALQVTAVDVSEEAIQMAKRNAARNHLCSQLDFQVANVFDLLPSLEKQPAAYDFIILDPPAFTKSRKTISNAMRGYKEINYRAMKLLPRGGWLATCSCSHFASEELFRNMLLSAAADAGVSLRQIEARQQSPDHPILWNVEETSYLKFFLFQVV